MTNSDKPDSVTESVQTASPAIRTGWWVLFALGLLAIGVVGAVLSVQLRRTQTDQTRLFFGPQAIAALESSTELRLHLPADGPLVPAGQVTETTVDLSDIPGVGHLRHALLDQRHYDWTTQQTQDIDQLAASGPTEKRIPGEWVTIELEGTPPGTPPIVATRFRIELSEGWVGIPGGQRRVRLEPRVAKAVRSHVLMMSNVRSTRADQPL